VPSIVGSFVFSSTIAPFKLMKLLQLVKTTSEKSVNGVKLKS